MKKAIYTLLITTVLLSDNDLLAQSGIENPAKKLDSVFSTYSRLNRFSGSVLIAQKGTVLLRKGYGRANREWDIPNTPSTRFRIGSISKQFTSMLIMQLHQSGKLDLQEKITAYLPWFDSTIGKKITIHHLLTNSSGLPNYTDEPNFMSEMVVQKLNPLEFAKKYFKNRLDFEPGAKYFYSNTNYFLLGLIIESITHKPYEQVLQENILNIAGMKNTGIDDPNKLIPNRAGGYYYNFDGYRNADYINMASATFACGALYSTVEDLYLWHQALNTEKLLSNENKKLMFTPGLSDYAYGWIIRDRDNFEGTGQRAIIQVHGGRINGFLSMIFRIPEQDIFIVILNNLWVPNYSGIIDEILVNAVDALFNKPVTLPKPTPAREMYLMLQNQPAKKAIAFYKNVKATQKAHYDFSNSKDLINLGDLLSNQLRIKDALDIYKLAADENPTSFTVIQKYALALTKTGEREQALIYIKLTGLSAEEKEKLIDKINTP